MQKKINSSKEIIVDALFNLMKEKDYQDITMSQIAKKSKLVRMTVYRHFKEKNQIILYDFSLYLDDHIKKSINPENASLDELLKFRFKVLKEYPHMHQIVENDLLNGIFDCRIGEDIACLNLLIPRIQDKYTDKFIIGGIDNITKVWINNGMSESYDEIVYKVITLISKLRIS